MPNKYLYERMDNVEMDSLCDEAGLSISDFMKLSGRHFNEVLEYLAPKNRAPTTPEMLIMLFLAERPELTADFLAVADQRIIGQKE